MADDVKHVEMLVVSGSNDDIQWFEFVVNFFAGRTRVEWDKGTMFATLPADTASFLISHRYARLMTDAEVKAHIKKTKPPEPVLTPPDPVPVAAADSPTDIAQPTPPDPTPKPKPRAKAPKKGESS